MTTTSIPFISQLSGLTEKFSTDLLVSWGIRIIAAILIVLIGKMVVNFIVKMVRKALTRTNKAPILIDFAENVLKIFLLLFVAILALNQVGFPTSSLVALIGAAGLAIGLALQDSLKNFASGFLLVLFRPFNVGHFVEAGGTSGSVEEIGIFTTTFRSPDNKEIIVPNGEIYSGTITNYSKKETRRVDMEFGIGYDDDLKKAKELLEQWIREDDRVLDEPECVIAVGELADSSVNIVVRPWVKTGDYWDFKFDYTEKAKLGFDEAGISIPYPQLDVHTKTD